MSARKPTVHDMVAQTLQRLWAGRHSGQQCWHEYPQTPRAAEHDGVAHHHRHQPEQCLSVLAGGLCPHGAGGGGKIINNGSMFSLFGGSHVLAYAASKGGVVQLTKSLAVAWAKDNIQVNAILPGWLHTDLTSGAMQDLPGLYERVLSPYAQGRWGQPEDLAGVAVFLASRASDFVTGVALPVDGGYSVMAP